MSNKGKYPGVSYIHINDKGHLYFSPVAIKKLDIRKGEFIKILSMNGEVYCYRTDNDLKNISIIDYLPKGDYQLEDPEYINKLDLFKLVPINNAGVTE